MSKLKKVLPLAIGALFLAASAQATTIDFTGLHGVTDPVVGPVSFWAGDPLVPNDTLVDDSVTPLNDYLMSGYADGTGNSPAAGYDTFIGVSKTGVAFGSASFDIASEYSFTMGGGNTTLWVEAYLAGALVGSDSVVVSDSTYQNLALTIAGGFDGLRIFDDLNASSLGEPFHIDNFVYSDYQTPPPPPPLPCTGPACNNAVPEPSALLLLGAGLVGMVYSKRRKGV